MDQYQNTLTSDGKSGGSMNLDEFLNSIWTAEENEAQVPNANTMVPTAEANTSLTNKNPQYHVGESSNSVREMSLTSQGSLSVPAASCQKTVEKVWSEISTNQQSTNNIPHAGSKQRKHSYGEMTLQEFLVEAGVVREEGPVAQNPPPCPHFQPQHHLQSHPAPPVFQPPRPAPPLLPRPQLPYGMYLNYDSRTMSNFMITGCGTSSVGVPSPFTPQSQTVGGTVATCLPVGNIRIGLQPAASFCGVGSASGVRGSESFGEMSAVSIDGIGVNKPGRKLMIDGPTEMMTERRKKRMIKNRESSARSRARKQAHTLELEVKLNQLRHENANLGKRLKEMESEAKQPQLEAAKTEAQAKAKEKPGTLRRTLSCSF